ncbi:hypothetical protein BaRGS_00025195 [Batillaria attramentaria]|uniref:Uncharacterized protein n=1 Tax=Batillaria attramentaria TaxID=370345 RepID=A0ABD0K8U4_9CAEN
MAAMKIADKVTQDEMHTKIKNGRKPVIRVGGTKRPIEERMKEYERKEPSTYNSSRTVFYADTTSAKMAEDNLLELCKGKGQCPENDQEASNMSEGVKGFVYMIK